VLDDRTLAFPSFDGNGIFSSLGNIEVNRRVGLLFIDFERGHRLRLRGEASVARGAPGRPSAHDARLSELQALRAPNAQGRGLAVRPTRWRARAGAELEA